MLRPTLQSVCGGRFPAPLRYGDPIAPGRVQRREVVVSKRGARGVIVGRTAPVVPTLGALARGRSSELCAPGYLVEVNGRAVAANARQVRELNRSPREPCPLHVQADAATMRALVLEAERMVAAGEAAHARDVLGDLAWPHHKGAAPGRSGSRGDSPVAARGGPGREARRCARRNARGADTLFRASQALAGYRRNSAAGEVPGGETVRALRLLLEGEPFAGYIITRKGNGRGGGSPRPFGWEVQSREARYTRNTPRQSLGAPGALVAVAGAVRV